MNGRYEDKTGVALPNTSPQQVQNIKENKLQFKMNNTKKKNVVRLTENDLHRIIKESVKNILKESSGWPLSDNNRTLPKDYDDEWEEGEIDDYLYRDPSNRKFSDASDCLSRLNNNIRPSDKEAENRRSWYDFDSEIFNKNRENSRKLVDLINWNADDLNKYHTPALNVYDDAKREVERNAAKNESLNRIIRESINKVFHDNL